VVARILHFLKKILAGHLANHLRKVLNNSNSRAAGVARARMVSNKLGETHRIP